jgi:hypothetical protein
VTAGRDQLEDPMMDVVWLPNFAGALASSCRGSLLTLEKQGGAWQWTASRDGRPLLQGTAATLAAAQTAAIAAAAGLAAQDVLP